MDARMGDGDLGLTMQKGFGALPRLMRENEVEGDIGKTLMKAGMKMAGLVPSTMGTLMSSGIMEGGKALAKRGRWGLRNWLIFSLVLPWGLHTAGSAVWGTGPSWMQWMPGQRWRSRPWLRAQIWEPCSAGQWRVQRKASEPRRICFPSMERPLFSQQKPGAFRTRALWPDSIFWKDWGGIFYKTRMRLNGNIRGYAQE